MVIIEYIARNACVSVRCVYNKREDTFNSICPCNCNYNCVFSTLNHTTTGDRVCSNWLLASASKRDALMEWNQILWKGNCNFSGLFFGHNSRTFRLVWVFDYQNEMSLYVKWIAIIRNVNIFKWIVISVN
jgi:hypothetical protein